MKLETKVAPKIKQRVTLVYAGAGFVLISIVGFILFFYLNIGNQEDTYANGQSYNSATDGNWTSSATWGGTAPSGTLNNDNVTINSSNTVTSNSDVTVNNNTVFNINSNGQLIILGDLIVNNNLTLNVNGTLIISGNLSTNNGASITVNGGGAVDISGNASFGNNATFVVDGVLTIEGTLTMGSGYSFSGSGTSTVGGAGCDYWNEGSSGTCQSNTTLPVELLNFVAKNVDQSVVITWETINELNNDFFTIEKSADGIDFESVADINGHGTKKELSSYEYTDHTPINGLSYYRLVQTDFDGTAEVFRPVSVTVELQADNGVEIFPNPLLGRTLRVRIENPEEGSLKIFDQSGYNIFTSELNGFDREEEINLPDNLMKGIYFVHVKTASIQKSFKLVKK